jgi:hypothetical protein
MWWNPGLVNTGIGNKEPAGWWTGCGSCARAAAYPPTFRRRPSRFCAIPSGQPQGLYYYQCRERRYSGQVTGENAERLFTLSETLLRRAVWKGE